MAETLDLVNLGTATIEGSDSPFEAPTEFFRPPEPTAKGEVTTVILDEAPADNRFYLLKDFETKEVIPGFAVNLRLKIIGGKQDGRIFFTMIDTRKSKTTNSNMVQNYLLSARYEGRLLTVQDYKDAVQTHFAPAKAILTWTGEKCELCQKKTLKKISDFPFKQNGERAHVAPCPDCGEDVGARVQIRMFKI